ncbi:MAG: hypothetical protein RIQ56_919 [Candidatus Parcubacteria bacterium]|jgi:hypothetical protein
MIPMRSFLKSIGNAALVFGGFLTVLFVGPKISSQSDHHDAGGLWGLGEFGNVAHADAPPSSDSASSSSSSGDSSDAGSDSGGCK